MSVNFSPYDPEREALGDDFVNLSNANARVLLEWLKLPGADEPQPMGMKEAMWVRRRCMLRLWRIDRNKDPGTETVVIQEPGHAKLIELGRQEGYLPKKTKQLLVLCHLAERQGYSHISWG